MVAGATIFGNSIIGTIGGPISFPIFSLGIETIGGLMTRVMHKRDVILSEKSHVFSTAADNQTSVKIRVFEGERLMAADNQLLR